MPTGTITIVNRLGLHARAAAKFVNLAKTFSSTISLSKKDGEPADGKSIMSVMLLAAPIGTELELETSGADETEAHAALSQLIEDRFGEEE
ncbi:MAG: HPr family phosphocarrier protein [Gammaproteobacteria bacterium]|nr:HPr family phosphocarrier protein [Gammaproteobacteria bacterium]